MNKTRFFDFGDLFHGRRRVPVVSEKSGAPVPVEVEGFAKVIQESQPAIEAIVRKARTVPGANLFTTILIVDGRPCLLSFKDDVPPEALEREVARMGAEMGKHAPAPANLPVGAPPVDLVAGIEKMLREIFKVEDTDVLGAVWSPSHAAAMKCAEIMEGAKKRDRANIVKGIAKLLEQP